MTKLIPRFGFVMEQTLGNVTYYRNLRSTIEADRTVTATWYPLSFEPEDVVENLPVLRSNWSGRGSWRAWRRLSRDHAANRFDALFFHTQVVTLLCTPLMRRVPTVISLDATPRNFDSLGAGYGHNQANRMVEGIKWRLTARVLHAAQALVAFSDWVRRSLIDDYGVPAERIHVIPPGVDLARWSVPVGHSGSNGCKHAPFRLLFVGGEFERKGGPLLLDVFRQSLRDCCELHIVTKANVEEEPGVHVYRDFGPNEQSLRHLYEHCDALVLPSRADTFSHASLEAMACGLPVVSCPVGGIPEIVRQGETGFLIPPDDGRALLTAIQGLLHDRGQSEALGEAGRKAVEARFDAARNAQRIRDLMTGLVRK